MSEGHVDTKSTLYTIEVRVLSRKFGVPIFSTSVWSQWPGRGWHCAMILPLCRRHSRGASGEKAACSGQDDGVRGVPRSADAVRADGACDEERSLCLLAGLKPGFYRMMT